MVDAHCIWWSKYCFFAVLTIFHLFCYFASFKSGCESAFRCKGFFSSPPALLLHQNEGNTCKTRENGEKQWTNKIFICKCSWQHPFGGLNIQHMVNINREGIVLETFSKNDFSPWYFCLDFYGFLCNFLNKFFEVFFNKY